MVFRQHFNLPTFDVSAKTHLAYRQNRVSTDKIRAYDF